MANPWVAIASTADPLRMARAIARARETVLSGGSAPPEILRSLVTDSWDRCAAAGIDPDRDVAPVLLDEHEVADRWERHPLFAVMPAVQALLAGVGEEARDLVVVTDADGYLLLVEGHPRVREHAERMNFVPGALWSEPAAGTNAPGTALAIDHAVQIFSTEHFNRVVHPWTCSAAPIHDPETGAALGAVDLTSGLKTAHPYSLSLVCAIADLAEGALRARLAERDERLRARYLERLAGRGPHPGAVVGAGGRIVAALPEGWSGTRVEVPQGGGEVVLPDGSTAVAEALDGGGHLLWPARAPARRGARPRLELHALGRDEADAVVAGQPLRLSRRHSELLVLLALHPEGLSAEQLLLELYGEELVNPVTARAEMSRLRAKLGPWLASKPYRLRADVRLDLLDVDRALARGRVDEALRRFAGPLLPCSEAPGIVAARDRLEGTLRRTVLESGEPDLLWRWCRGPCGAGDAGALRALARRLAPGDPRHAWALTALGRATAADGGGAARRGRRPAGS